MSKEERFNSAVNYLKGQGKVRTQKDIAAAIGTDKSNLSRALNGDEKYLTDNFLKRFNRAFGDIFNIDYLLGKAEEMFCPPSGDINALYDVESSNVGNVINGDGNHHNHQQVGGDAVKDKEIEMLKDKVAMQDKAIADKDEEIRFLRAMLQKQHDI